VGARAAAEAVTNPGHREIFLKARVLGVDACPAYGRKLVDAGRLSARSPALPLATAAAATIVVSGGSFPLLQLLPHRIDALRAAGCTPSVAVVEPTPWPVDEIAEFVGADVVVVLPHVAAGRRTGPGAMGTSAWRPWWRRVEDAAAYLDASVASEVRR
jgi:hypothetical protein